LDKESRSHIDDKVKKGYEMRTSAWHEKTYLPLGSL